MSILESHPLKIVIALTYGFQLSSCGSQDPTKHDDMSDTEMADSDVSDSSFPDFDTWNPDSPDGTELTWPVVCGGEYPCFGEFRGNPPPYDQCRLPSLYWRCPDDSCIPEEGSLIEFYLAWLNVSPALLGMQADEFSSHVFLNLLRQDTLADGTQSYRVQFLVAFDWVLAAEEHIATIDLGVVPTMTIFEEALNDRLGNHFIGLPREVIPIEDVRELAAKCGSGIDIRLCHVFYNKLASERGVGFWLRESSPTDESGYAWVADIDLVSGDIYCVRKVFAD